MLSVLTLTSALAPGLRAPPPLAPLAAPPSLRRCAALPLGSRACAARMALPSGEKCSFVLLAGGSGSRMKADRPKQFLDLLGKPVLQWDLELLLGIEELDRIVLVIAEEFRTMEFLQPFVDAED